MCSLKGCCSSLKGCCFHIFDISKPFCHYNSGILCHAELQVAINPTYSHLFIYLDSIISITIIFVDASENGGQCQFEGSNYGINNNIHNM